MQGISHRYEGGYQVFRWGAVILTWLSHRNQNQKSANPTAYNRYGRNNLWRYRQTMIEAHDANRRVSSCRTIVEQDFHASDELCSLFLDDSFQFQDSLSRKCRADCRTTHIVEIVASCSRGSYLQTKRVFRTDIVQLSKFSGRRDESRQGQLGLPMVLTTGALSWLEQCHIPYCWFTFSTWKQNWLLSLNRLYFTMYKCVTDIQKIVLGL